jgi:hypothetical protein
VVRAEGLKKVQRKPFELVEFRGASLLEYELGSRGIELRNFIRIIECSSMEFNG